jgi:hypothetical protein
MVGFWNSVVNMEGDYRAQSMAWCNCLGVHRSRYSLECMVHRAHGNSCRNVNGNNGPKTMLSQNLTGDLTVDEIE